MGRAGLRALNHLVTSLGATEIGTPTVAPLQPWTCRYSGLTMGATDSPIQLTAVDGLLSSPEIRSSDLELVQRDGLWAGDDYMSGRTVTLTLSVFGETPAEFTRALAQIQAAFEPGRAETQLQFRFPGLADDRPAAVLVQIGRAHV